MKKFFVLCSLFLSQAAFAQSYVAETQEVNEYLAATVVDATYNYCIKGTLTCRSLIFRKDKITGVRAAAFNDVFVSAERAVGSNGYFLPNANNTFRATVDDVFNGEVMITRKFAENQNITVTFDEDGYPTLHNVSVIRVGTTRSVLADIVYNGMESTIIGVETDSADPTYSVPVAITYTRQN